jgi:prevent-host-death family protein
MREITVTEVRKRWGALLDLVEQGEDIVITRRGKRIARLVPDSQDHETSPDG